MRPYRGPLHRCWQNSIAFRCRAQALQQCDLERFGLPPWSYIRALENAIVRAVEAGAGDRNDAASPPGGNHECLRLLATFGESKKNGSRSISSLDGPVEDSYDSRLDGCAN